MKRGIFAALAILMALTFSLPSLPCYGASIEPALVQTFGNEGGFQNDPYDSGNYAHGILVGTKYGICAASYPNEDIRHLTLERAAFLYNNDFWGVSRCNEWKSQIVANIYFDFAVNIGQKTAAKIIQRAINYAGYPLKRIPVDGIIGSATVKRLNEIDQDLVFVHLVGLTHNRYVEIVDKNPRKERHLKEWATRMERNVRRAVHEYEAKRAKK